MVKLLNMELDDIVDLMNDATDDYFQTFYKMEDLDKYCEQHSIGATELLENIPNDYCHFDIKDKYFYSISGDDRASELASFNYPEDVEPNIYQILADHLMEEMED